MIPPVVPGAEVHERLGVGGLAEVWRATWAGREVALKVMLDPSRRPLVRRFLREGRLLSRIDHPGVVRCHAVIEGPPPALVLERLRGESLDRRLRRRLLRPAEAEQLAVDVLRALDHLHDRGIVHRDVKASNLWVGEDGHGRLLDLGLAADASDPLTTTLGAVIGTYAYMAPEHLAGLETDRRADLYSLGVTLYEALSGRRPYEAVSAAGYLQAHRLGRRSPLRAWVPDLPGRLERLVDALLATDPADRPPSAVAALRLLLGSPEGGLAPPRWVGREGLRGAVLAALHDGGALRVEGEPGSGLGAGARLARRVAAEEGVTVVGARLTRRTGRLDGAALVNRALGPALAPGAADPDAVAAALDGLAGEAPGALLVVEDADLAEPELVAWVEARVGAGLRVVTFGLPGSEWTLGRRHELRPLEGEETARLLAAMLASDRPPAGLAEWVQAETAGLPALAVALVRQLAAAGALTREGGRWTWRPGPSPALWDDRARARLLGALPEGARRLVEAAAVAQEAVPLEVLHAAAEVDPAGGDLAAAVRAGLLEATPVLDGPGVVLHRAAIGRPLLRALPVERRRTLHRRLAAGAAAFDDPWARRFALGQLAEGAATPEDARALLAEAGAALREGRWREARRAAERAGALLPGEAGAAAAVVRAGALLGARRATEAADALRAARRLAPEGAVDPEIGVGAELAVGRLPTRARLAALDAAPAEVRRLVGAEVSRRRGDLVGALDALDGLLADAPDALAPRALFALALRGRLLGELGQPEEARAALATRVATLRELGRVEPAADLALVSARLALQVGRPGLAMERVRFVRSVVSGDDPLAALAEATAARAELVVRGRLGDAAMARLAALEVEGLDWEVRVAVAEARVEARFAGGDLAAARVTALAAADAADAAGDTLRRAAFAGVVGAVGGDADALASGTETLAAAGAHRSLALLLHVAAQLGRDPSLFAAAEAEARLAEDRPRLLAVLGATREPDTRAEAAGIVAGIARELGPDDRAALMQRPVARWALGERSSTRRDTGP